MSEDGPSMQVRAVTRLEAVAAVLTEREAQEAEFGMQRHDPAYWLAILGKQVGQLGEAVIQYKWNPPQDRSHAEDKMFREASQVAAVAMALMEAIILGDLPDEVTTARPKDARLTAKAMGRGDEDMLARAHARASDDEEGLSNDLC